MEEKLSLLKERMKMLPDVIGAGLSSGIPGAGLTQNGYAPEGYDKAMMFHALDIDEDFIPVMKMELVSGRNFSAEMGTDDTKMLINETLARQLGWDDPVGKTIHRDTTFTVIGVVKDFHYSRVQEKIRPLVITLNKNYRRQNLVLRLQNTQPETVKSVESAFHEIFPEHSFMFHFLDKRLEYMFRSEQQFAKIILTASCIAILITSLGLFALGTFSAERRTREIGIRKAMGASAFRILHLLLSEFTWKVLLANIFAYPFVWFFITRWLENYEYRISLSAWVFITGTLLSLLLTILTVGYQAWKASLTNPAETLKYE